MLFEAELGKLEITAKDTVKMLKIPLLFSLDKLSQEEAIELLDLCGETAEVKLVKKYVQEELPGTNVSQPTSIRKMIG